MLTALELALRDRYGHRVEEGRRKGSRKPISKRRNLQLGPITFAHLLKYMAADDGLTDEKMPIIRRCGGSVLGLLTGERNPSLAQIRNDLAHGFPFHGFPQAGLIELVRDLIEYAYRDIVTDARMHVIPSPP